MRDHRTRSLLRARGSVLYAVFTIEELILLRAWGLPAVLAADLFYPVTDRLSELASACGWAMPTDQQPDACPEPDASEITQPAAAAAEPATDEAVADRPDAQPVAAAAFAAAGEASDAVDQSETGEEVQPTMETAEESNSRAVDPFEVRILTWSPTTLSLDPPVGCEELLSQLLDAERHWGGNISEIAAWQPRPEQLDGIRRYLDRGSVSDAFAVISRSADHDLFALDFISRQIAAGRRPPLGFLDAQRELRAWLGQTAAGRDAKKVSAARTAYESAVDREIVAPIVAQAFSCTDPAKCSLGLAAAEFARAFHYAAPYVSGSPGGIAQGSLADANRLLTMAVLTTTTFGIFLREFSPLWVRVCWTSESFVDGCKPS